VGRRPPPGRHALAVTARILLLRHAQSEWNAEGRWQGWADAPLSEDGRLHALEAAGWIATLGIEAVACSDLRRASETAAVLARAAGAAGPVVDARLREREIGWWSGLRTDEIVERWPGQLEAWREGRLARPPGGETDESVLVRARAALRRLAGEAASWVAVTHGGLIGALERATGVGRGPGTNLSGRWIHVAGDDLRPGDPVAAPLMP